MLLTVFFLGCGQPHTLRSEGIGEKSSKKVDEPKSSFEKPKSVGEASIVDAGPEQDGVYEAPEETGGHDFPEVQEGKPFPEEMHSDGGEGILNPEKHVPEHKVPEQPSTQPSRCALPTVPVQKMGSRNHKGVKWSWDQKYIVSWTYNKIYVWDVATGLQVRKISGLDYTKGNPVLSPSQPYVAFVSGPFPHSLHVVNFITGKRVHSWKISNRIQGHKILGRMGQQFLGWRKKGTQLVLAHNNGALVWSITSGKQSHTIFWNNNFFDLRFATQPLGTRIAISKLGQKNGEVFIWDWDIQRTKPIASFKTGLYPIWGVSLSGDGKWLAVASRDEAQIWSVAQKKMVKKLQGGKHCVSTPQFHPNGSHLLCSSKTWGVKLEVWDFIKGMHVRTLELPGPSIYSTAISPNGSSLLLLSRFIRVYSWAGKYGFTIEPSYITSSNAIETVVASADTSTFVSAGSGAIVWKDGAAPHIKPISRWSHDARLSANGGVLLLLGRFRADFYDTKTGKVLSSQSYGGDAVDLHPDGKSFAYQHYSGVKIFSTTGRAKELHTIPLRGIKSLGYHPSGKWLFVVSNDIKIYDTKTWKVWRTLQETPTNVVWSPDGRTLAVHGRQLKIYETVRWTSILTVPVPSRGIQWSFKSDKLAIWQQDKITIWSPVQRKMLLSIPTTEKNNIKALLAWHSDGNIIAVHSLKHASITVLWDTQTGKKVKELNVIPDSSLHFGRSSGRLYVSGRQSVEVWGCPCKLGTVRSCYTEPLETKGIGICRAGKQRCYPGGWGKCSGEAFAMTERSGDKLDSNCNGHLDR